MVSNSFGMKISLEFGPFVSGRKKMKIPLRFEVVTSTIFLLDAIPPIIHSRRLYITITYTSKTGWVP